MTAVCTGLTDMGYGVAEIENTPVYIPDFLPGEKAEIRIIKTFSRYAIGKVIQLLSKSESRVTPVCPVFGKCGGCAYQNMDYQMQLQMKEEQMKRLFASVDPDIAIKPVIGMDDPYYYRNKAQFPIEVKDGQVLSGFYRIKSNQIIPVEKCFIQSEEINDIYQWILKNISLQQAKNLRHVFIRVSKGTKQAQVVFIGQKNIDLKALAQKLAIKFPNIKSILFNENKRKDNVILGESYTVLYGSDFIEEQCLDLTILLHFKSFFQVNPEQMEKLYTCALEAAHLKESDDVIELYSGTGTIGLLASRKSKSVIGVEIVPEAVANAKENARINHIENAQFVCQDASVFAAAYARDQKKADVVFIDPPRKGMSEQGIEDTSLLAPEKIVYISCNPRTLARDIKLFMAKGYICRYIQPVDMFPHTANLEAVCLLLKDKSNPAK